MIEKTPLEYAVLASVAILVALFLAVALVGATA